MAYDDAVRFIRKNGKVIPIRATSGAAKVATAGAVIAATRKPSSPPPTKLHAIANKLTKNNSIKPNFMLKYGSEALAVGEGAASALIPVHGAKSVAAATALHFGGEAAITGAGAAAYAGRGHRALRARGIAKQEVTNQALGWGTYAAVSLGSKAGRDNLANTGKAAFAVSKKILSFARRTLGVVEE